MSKPKQRIAVLWKIMLIRSSTGNNGQTQWGGWLRKYDTEQIRRNKRRFSENRRRLARMEIRPVVKVFQKPDEDPDHEKPLSWKQPFKPPPKFPKSRDRMFKSRREDWKTRPCVYCESREHKPVYCGKVVGVALQKKYLSEKRLGFNCTGTRHRAAECRNVSGCQKCNGRQPTSICDGDSQQMLLAAGEGAVIYFVMVVDVDGIKCRALLDTDASAALIKKLGKQPSRMEHKRIDMMTCSTNQKVYKYDVKISSVVGDFNMATSVSKVDFGVHHLGTCLSKCWVWTMLAQYYTDTARRETVKLILCLTWAIHLELLSDQTTVEFIKAFKRFIAKKGRQQKVYSDNGSSFVADSKRLSSIMRDDKVQEYLAHQHITWHFNSGQATILKSGHSKPWKVLFSVVLFFTYYLVIFHTFHDRTNQNCEPQQWHTFFLHFSVILLFQVVFGAQLCVYSK